MSEDRNPWLYYPLAVLLVLLACGIILTLWARPTDEDGIFNSYLLLSSSFAGAAFVLLMDHSISYHRLSTKEIGRTFSGIYLSLAMLTWALRGATYFILPNYIDFLKPIFSTVNSAFFILAMKGIFFQGGDMPKWRKLTVVSLFRKERFVWTLSFITIIVSMLLPYILDEGMLKDNIDKIGVLPDFIFSTITIIYMAATLSHAFKVRGLKILGYMVYVSLSMAFLVQVFSLMGWKVKPLSYFYPFSMEILLFGLLASYHSYFSLFREQQQKKDMNHAIRNGLLDLRYDIGQGGIQNDDLSLDIIERIKALEALHDHLHSEARSGVHVSKYLKVLMLHFAKARALDDTQFKYEIHLPHHLYTEDPDIARKLGRVVVEIITNAYQAMRENNQAILIKSHFYIEKNALLVVEVEDIGPGFKYNRDDPNLNFGLRNVDDIVSDFRGSISIEPLKKKGSIAKIVLPTQNFFYYENSGS